MDFRVMSNVFEALGTVSRDMEWYKWVEEIPYVEWPQGWQVKAVPPFSGAVIRYLVRRGDTPTGRRVSVYLDCYAILGATLDPYWEVYPGHEDGEINRCTMPDINKLLEQIETGLDYLARAHPYSEESSRQ